MGNGEGFLRGEGMKIERRGKVKGEWGLEGGRNSEEREERTGKGEMRKN